MCVIYLGYSSALIFLTLLALHESRARQSIMMPAMSPLMTEGTVKRWKKKEGETFRAGDVLLQIVSGNYTSDRLLLAH